VRKKGFGDWSFGGGMVYWVVDCCIVSLLDCLIVSLFYCLIVGRHGNSRNLFLNEF
jgi:hypothetical protein